MMIQLNTDNNITGREELQASVESRIKETLGRFDDHITRIEVHFKDENGQKKGTDDIRCALEARLENKEPITVSNNADSVELALNGAINKMKKVLDSAIEKQRGH
ncbi:MAG: HPF/RaiA family ribosome-associated protein [Flavitalea sp.]